MFAFSTALCLLLGWLLLAWLLLGWLLFVWLLLEWLILKFNPNKTPLGETAYLGNLYFLRIGCLGIHFSFTFCPTQSVRLPLVTYPSLCSTCMTYRTPYHSIGHQVLPILLLPREADDFLRGGKHSTHVPLLTYLAWLQPLNKNSRLLFKHVKIKNIFLEQRCKVVFTLISSHFNQLSIVLTNFI